MEVRERKAFNFYASYYEVYKELPEKERLKFIDAIFQKQFYDIDPELTGMAKFAYLSQKHSIDKQVEGFKIKTNSKLPTPCYDPCQGGTQGGCQGSTVQEK